MNARISEKIFSILLTALVATANIHAGPLTPESLPKSAAISVDTKVAMPKTTYYLGPDQGNGLIFGAIGGLVEGAMNQDKKPEQVIIEFAEKNNIVVADIVREETLAALKKNGLATSDDGGKQALC